MTGILIRLFVKDSENVKDTKVRGAYGTLAGIVGIICNIILCAGKMFVGIISGSVSITADALNNLTDATSSIVTLIGFQLAKKPADEDHPFGHARFEYLSGLAVAAMILIIGFQLAKSSIEKIINPTDVNFTKALGIVMIISILGKFWLYLFNRKIAKKISSTSISATADDARNDVITTTAVLQGIVIAQVIGINLDGYIGVVVSLFIFISGINTAKETISPLLGAPADEELVKMISDNMLEYDSRILGIHDLMVHDYGPGQRFASVHAEIDRNEDVMSAHELLDNIERMFLEEHRIQMVIHYDPIVTDDQELNKMKAVILEEIAEIDEKFKIHDFRMVKGNEHTNLIFDMVIPRSYEGKQLEIKAMLDKKLSEYEHKYYTVITFDFESFNMM
ncbi:MAG: cation transporter [Oscillospiraceae bacterium]|nr:cation transporter [Oscillospiraceae bacterium]